MYNKGELVTTSALPYVYIKIFQKGSILSSNYAASAGLFKIQGLDPKLLALIVGLMPIKCRQFPDYFLCAAVEGVELAEWEIYVLFICKAGTA